jgi:hypothetical protein
MNQSPNAAKLAVPPGNSEAAPLSPPGAATYPPWCSSAKSEYAHELDRLNSCRRDKDCFYFDSCNPISITAERRRLVELRLALTSNRCGFQVVDCCRAAPRCIAKRCVAGGSTDDETCARERKAARRRVRLPGK